MKRITVLIIGSMFIAMQAIAQTEDKKELIIKDKRLVLLYQNKKVAIFDLSH